MIKHDTNSLISRELRLNLLLSDRTGLISDNQITELLKSDIDWDQFIEIGVLHKLFLPSINKLVEFKEYVPQEKFVEIQKKRMNLLRKMMVLDYETQRITKELKELSIEILPLRVQSLQR